MLCSQTEAVFPGSFLFRISNNDLRKWSKEQKIQILKLVNHSMLGRLANTLKDKIRS